MSTNGHPQPSPADWAAASLHVHRHDHGPQPVFHLQKSVARQGRTFEQSVWITRGQLQALARDHCQRPTDPGQQ
jgi:hypothetical protein